MNKRTKQLAEWLDLGSDPYDKAAAAELRRLHSLNQELVEALERLMVCAIKWDQGMTKYAIEQAEKQDADQWYEKALWGEKQEPVNGYTKSQVHGYTAPLDAKLVLKTNKDGAICGMGVKVDWPTFHLIDCGWNATEVRNLTRAVSPELLTEWVSYCAESRDPQVWMVAQGVATPLLLCEGGSVWVFKVNRVGEDIVNEQA